MDDDLFETRWEDAQSDEELLDDVRRFRETFFLPADDATVRHMLAEYRAGRQDAGEWETADERAAQAEREERLEPVRDAARRYVEGAGAAALAGEWISWDGGQRWNVAFAGDPSPHEAALREHVGDTDLLVVRGARYTEAELDAIAERLTDDDAVVAAAALQVSGSGPDTVDNVVELELFGPDEQAARRLVADRYGDVVRVRWLGSETEVVEAQEWQRWSLDADGRTLTVHYLAWAAGAFERVEAAESPDEVRVTVFDRLPAGAMNAAGATRSATVILAGPLADRTVVDGASGRERAQTGAAG